MGVGIAETTDSCLRMSELPAVIKLLAHDLRWQMVQLLAVGDYRVNELVTLLDQPLNLVSYHLKQLRMGELVVMRRSEADRRDNYYSLDLDYLHRLYQQAGETLHPTVACNHIPAPTLTQPPSVLFVCTHNSARSQMAEALMRHQSNGQIAVMSAGSSPTSIHPDAIRTMDRLDIDIRHQQSKGFQDVADHSFDFVITVCDQAREVCPTFTGDGQHIHWGIPDPATIENERERQTAFARAADRLAARTNHFLQELQTRENTN